MNKFGKNENCAHRVGQEGVLEAPRVDFEVHFASFFDMIQQFFGKAWCQEDLETTGKKHNSHEAEKNKEVTVRAGKTQGRIGREPARLGKDH